MFLKKNNETLMSDYKYKKYNIFIIIFLIFFGSILRIYNINYDDLWSDEMVSFWIADPNISFSDTMNRIFNSNWSFSKKHFGSNYS